MASSATTTDQLAAAADRLRRARDLRDVTEPLRRLLAQVDENTRAAAQAAASAGLSERVIATLAGVSQPTAHGWLDERHGVPVPSPSLGAEIWNLHTVAAALRGLVVRLEGQHLSELGPSTRHAAPADEARRARDGLAQAVEALGQLGAAVEYEEGPRG